MEWFEKFVEETRSLWQKEKGDITAELLKEITKMFEDMSNKEKGDLGEELVLNLLSSKDFTTQQTVRSETPSDVWGIRVYSNYVHITLIQVKTTKAKEAPQKLNDEDITQLRIFTKFVLDRFKVSEFVPNELKSKVVLISNGYAGVKIADDNSTEIVLSKAFTFWLPKKLSQFEDLFKELVRLTHKLQ
jgi:hypothetical protein